MDLSQMLPLLLKGKLGEKEQALLRATQTQDPAALTTLLTQMYASQPPQNADVFATFKKIIPAETLGMIIKYFDARKA